MADERKYYVMCENKCLFEGMTKEQILAAIAQTTGNTVSDVDRAFITKIKELNKGEPLQFWVGTQAEYNEQSANLVDNVFCIITDDTTADDINAAIKAMQETAATLEQSLSNVTQELEEHGAKLEEHGVQLVRHGEQFVRHSEQLEEINDKITKFTEEEIKYGGSGANKDTVIGTVKRYNTGLVVLTLNFVVEDIRTDGTALMFEAENLKAEFRPKREVVYGCGGCTTASYKLEPFVIAIQGNGRISIPDVTYRSLTADPPLIYSGTIVYMN